MSHEEFLPPDEYLKQLYRNARTESERQQIEEEWKQFMVPQRRSVSYPNSHLKPLGLSPLAALENMISDLTLEALKVPLMSPVFTLPPAGGITVRFSNSVETTEKPPKYKPLAEDHIVSAIVGYRAWNVPLFVDELRSVARSDRWVPYQRFEAECDENQCHGVSCGCGIYAFKKMDSVQKEYRQESDRALRYVWGECWLWGRILECTLGYRAQFAYPKAFINTGAISKRMAEVFGVELINQ